MPQKIVLVVTVAFYLGAVAASGVFMYWHNGKWSESVALMIAVACGLGFIYLARFLP